MASNQEHEHGASQTRHLELQSTRRSRIITPAKSRHFPTPRQRCRAPFAAPAGRALATCPPFGVAHTGQADVHCRRTAVVCFSQTPRTVFSVLFPLCSLLGVSLVILPACFVVLSFPFLCLFPFLLACYLIFLLCLLLLFTFSCLFTTCMCQFAFFAVFLLCLCLLGSLFPSFMS